MTWKNNRVYKCLGSVVQCIENISDLTPSDNNNSIYQKHRKNNQARHKTFRTTEAIGLKGPDETH